MLSRALILPRLCSSLVVRRSFQTSSVASSGSEQWWNPEQANGREVVGHGAFNDEDYQDRQDYWYPAIRFRKDDAVILPIKEKEMGDWKNLSMDEKKLLYRYSYRQTMAEYSAPHGYWKVQLGALLCIVGLTALYVAWIKVYCWPSAPVTYDPEFKEAETERALVLKKNSVEAPVTEFDYENNRWK